MPASRAHFPFIHSPLLKISERLFGSHLTESPQSPLLPVGRSMSRKAWEEACLGKPGWALQGRRGQGSDFRCF